MSETGTVQRDVVHCVDCDVWGWQHSDSNAQPPECNCAESEKETQEKETQANE